VRENGGQYKIVKFTAVDDAGNIVNHQIVEGQMQGGITRGRARCSARRLYTTGERAALTGSFMDYPMPRRPRGRPPIHEHPVPTASNLWAPRASGSA